MRKYGGDCMCGVDELGSSKRVTVDSQSVTLAFPNLAVTDPSHLSTRFRSVSRTHVRILESHTTAFDSALLSYIYN